MVGNLISMFHVTSKEFKYKTNVYSYVCPYVTGYDLNKSTEQLFPSNLRKDRDNSTSRKYIIPLYPAFFFPLTIPIIT